MKFRGRYLPWIIVACLTLLLLWSPWRRAKTGLNFINGRAGGYEADLIVDGLRYTRNIGDKVQWTLASDTASLYESKKVMYLKRVKIDFFQNGGSKIVALADTGTYKIDGDLGLDGHVIMNLPNGQTLNSDTLNLNQKKGIIWSKDSVLIKGNGLVMKGKGLEYDLKGGRLKIRSQTSVISSRSTMGF